MNGEPDGWDFMYDESLRPLIQGLQGELGRQLREVEAELLRDQSERNPRIRWRHGITSIGVIETEHLEVYFQRMNPMVAWVSDIQFKGQGLGRLSGH